MHEINSRYRQVDSTKQQIGPLAFFSNNHKKDREWHVLGSVQQLLAKAGITTPIYAEESEARDFIAYTDNGQLWAKVEIVEVIRPNEKRHDSYRRATSPDAPLFRSISPPLTDPWMPLRTQIQAKARMDYPKGTILVVYYDIGRFSFNDWLTPFNEQLLEEHSRSAFQHAEMFDRLLVLSSDMQCLVQLHPAPCIIVPDAQC